MRGGVAFLGVGAVLERDHPGGVRTYRPARRGQVVRPPATHQRVGFGGARVAADHRRTAQLVGPQHRHLTGVRIRGSGFDQGVVTVVPDQHQSEIGDGREGGAARPDHQPRLTAQRAQPAPVPLGRPKSGRQGDHPSVRNQRRRGRLQLVDVALVGNHGQHTPARCDRRRGDFGQPLRPRLPRQRLPHRACRAALLEGGDELRAALVRRPRRGIDGLRIEWFERGCGLLLDGGVPRRHRQAQHVGPGARITGCDGVGETPDLVGQHRFAGDHLVQPAELPDVVGVGAAFEEETVDEPTVEPDPDPDAGLGLVGLIGRDEVVELAVEVRHRQHRQHTRDRLVLGRVPGGAHPAGVAEAPDGDPNDRPNNSPAVSSSSEAA